MKLILVLFVALFSMALATENADPAPVSFPSVIYSWVHI